MGKFNLNNTIEQVKELNAQIEKGSIDAFNIALQMAKLCAKGRDHWKANKKELGLNRDELAEAFGFKKSNFSDLCKAGEVSKKDVNRYLKDSDSVRGYTINGLLKFLKADKQEDAPTALITLSRAKDEGEKGCAIRYMSDGTIKTSGDIEMLSEAVHVLQMEIEKLQGAQVESIELVEKVMA